MLLNSRRLYKKEKYYKRDKLQSFVNKTSKHIIKARKIYKINSIKPSIELSKKTKIVIIALYYRQLSADFKMIEL